MWIITHAFAFVMGVVLSKPFFILVKKLTDQTDKV